MLSIVAANLNKLETALRQSVNAHLIKAGFDGNTPWPRLGQGLTHLTSVLSDEGIEVLSTFNSHLFMSDDGTVRMDIAFANAADPFSPVDIHNSILVIQYHKHQSGRYEIVSYLS